MKLKPQLKLAVMWGLLSGVQALGAVGGATVIDVTETNYADGFDMKYFEYVDDWTDVLIAVTEVRYDMTDLVMRAQWNTNTIDTWIVTTDEWAITLELTSSRLRDFGGARPSEMHYGFSLSLEKTDGSWSHTLLNLGSWSSRMFGPFRTDGNIVEGTSVGHYAPLGGRVTHSTLNSGGIPVAILNGGVFDTGWVQSFNQPQQLDFADIPVNDEWWYVSLSVGFEDGDMLARFGLGQEISRETLIVPEPKAWALMGVGLLWLWLVGSGWRTTTARVSLKAPFRRFQNGGAEGSRTPDLLNAIQTLYQLSYDPRPIGANLRRPPALSNLLPEPARAPKSNPAILAPIRSGYSRPRTRRPSGVIID
jgi:hypothetical protein